MPQSFINMNSIHAVNFFIFLKMVIIFKLKTPDFQFLERMQFIINVYSTHIAHYRTRRYFYSMVYFQIKREIMYGF